MSDPVFVRTAYTGQPETVDEEVVCPVCTGLTHLRWTAWLDPLNKSYGPGGCYVCYGCLSAERKAELSAARDTMTYPPLSLS